MKHTAQKPTKVPAPPHNLPPKNHTSAQIKPPQLIESYVVIIGRTRIYETPDLSVPAKRRNKRPNDISPFRNREHRFPAR